MKRELRIAGFGGQGVILAGFIIGKAACVYADFNAVQSQSYGPEARGGADERIGYPRPTGVDLFVSMAQEAFNTNGVDVTDDTVVIVDPDLVPHNDIGRPIYKVQAQKIAEGLGNKVVTNIAMIGAVAGIYDVPPAEALKKSVEVSVPARFIKLNQMAFDQGLEAGKNARPE